VHRHSRNDQIVGANHQPGVCQLQPKARMDSRDRGIQRHDFEPTKSLFQPALSPSEPGGI
jgi:hypothetical protein